MNEIHAEIEIEAPAERVWHILVDFASYRHWNPFIVQAVGEPKINSRLEVRIQAPGSRIMGFQATVLRAEPNRELRWRGRFWMPGLFDGEHSFIVEPHGPDRARFVQHETFTGLLVPLVLRGMRSNIRRGFEEMNLALKARAEQG